MSTKIKKLKLNIKGNWRLFWSDILLKYKTWAEGVTLHKVKHHSSDHVEVFLSGEKDKLWKVIGWTKNPIMFLYMNEILIEFAD